MNKNNPKRLFTNQMMNYTSINYNIRNGPIPEIYLPRLNQDEIEKTWTGQLPAQSESIAF